jgi:hypothetical protein
MKITYDLKGLRTLTFLGAYPLQPFCSFPKEHPLFLEMPPFPVDFVITQEIEKHTMGNIWPTGTLRGVLVGLFLFLFETGSHYLAQAGLNLRSSCLSLPSARITGKNHYVQLIY